MTPSDGWTPEEVAIAHMGMLSIYRNRLKNDWERLVVALRFDLKWPISDISFATGRSDTTVRNVIERIRKRLGKKRKDI